MLTTLTVCTRCHNLSQRTYKLFRPALLRFLSSESAKSPATEESLDSSSGCSKETIQFYEDAKAFFPYHMPWRLGPEYMRQVDETHKIAGKLVSCC